MRSRCNGDTSHGYPPLYYFDGDFDHSKSLNAWTFAEFIYRTSSRLRAVLSRILLRQNHGTRHLHWRRPHGLHAVRRHNKGSITT